MKLTRRDLAAAVLGSAAAAQAQTQASTPEALLKAAHDRNKANSDLLAKQQIPMDTEPAFQFKA